MRFLVQPEALLDDWPEAHRAYLSAPDQTVWPTRIELQGNHLLCRRQCSDSGKLHVAWPVPGVGRPVLTTASLPERGETTYLLPLELARGKIVQVRNQLATWQAGGMTVPDDFQKLHRDAHTLFARAVSQQDRPAESAATCQQVLATEMKAADALMRAYIRQRLDARIKQYSNLPAALGCSLGHSAPSAAWLKTFPAAFNSAAVNLEWRNIEPDEGDYHWEAFDTQVDWSLANGLIIRGGPLLDLSPQGLPEWLRNWESDYWNLLSFVQDFVETVISRYTGRIRIWEVCARANTGGGLALTEEQRLTLTAKILEVARHADEEGQFVVRIDQPWGEYQARGQHRLSPMQFADALVRAGLGVSALNLEIAVGYAPRGSAFRDLLDVSRMIDVWSTLGIPLQVTLAFPSSAEHDPNVTTDLEVQPGAPLGLFSEQSQRDWVEQMVSLLLSKPAVIAVFWAHYSDAVPHRFPHAGMLRADGTAKPALERMTAFRRTYWK